MVSYTRRCVPLWRQWHSTAMLFNPCWVLPHSDHNGVAGQSNPPLFRSIKRTHIKTYSLDHSGRRHCGRVCLLIDPSPFHATWKRDGFPIHWIVEADVNLLGVRRLFTSRTYPPFWALNTQGASRLNIQSVLMAVTLVWWKTPLPAVWVEAVTVL